MTQIKEAYRAPAADSDGGSGPSGLGRAAVSHAHSRPGCGVAATRAGAAGALKTEPGGPRAVERESETPACEHSLSLSPCLSLSRPRSLSLSASVLLSLSPSLPPSLPFPPSPPFLLSLSLASFKSFHSPDHLKDPCVPSSSTSVCGSGSTAGASRPGSCSRYGTSPPAVPPGEPRRRRVARRHPGFRRRAGLAGSKDLTVGLGFPGSRSPARGPVANATVSPLPRCATSSIASPVSRPGSRSRCLTASGRRCVARRRVPDLAAAEQGDGLCARRPRVVYWYRLSELS